MKSIPEPPKERLYNVQVRIDQTIIVFRTVLATSAAVAQKRGQQLAIQAMSISVQQKTK